MKKTICLLLAVLLLTASLTGCSDNVTRSGDDRTGTSDNARTVQPYSGNRNRNASEYGNVSTSRNGTVNGTNRYLGGFDDMIEDVQ